MKILLTCQFFNYCSGSAVYIHDLSVELARRGHNVTVLSETGGALKASAVQNGVRTVDFSQIFDIQDEKFDIIHGSQFHPTQLALDFFPNTPAVFTIHSSFLNIENPFKHPAIRRYMVVKETEAEKYKDLNPVYIPLGIPFDKFNTKNEEKALQAKKDTGMTKKIVLFIGTHDFLRAKPLADLAKKGIDEDFEVWWIGKNFMPFKPPANVKCIPETFFIEKWIEVADETASILMGRVSVESWACGKSYWHYDVDEMGTIKKCELLPPPFDMSQYDIKYMTDRVEEVYSQAIV
jgi:hypothetical protein